MKMIKIIALSVLLILSIKIGLFAQTEKAVISNPDVKKL